MTEFWFVVTDLFICILNKNKSLFSQFKTTYLTWLNGVAQQMLSALQIV